MIRRTVVSADLASAGAFTRMGYLLTARNAFREHFHKLPNRLEINKEDLDILLRDNQVSSADPIGSIEKMMGCTVVLDLTLSNNTARLVHEYTVTNT